MRCPNCGWPNKSQEKFCTKCNAPLDSTFSAVDGLSSDHLQGTIQEEQPFSSHTSPSPKMPTQLNNVQHESKNTVCPKCGYPLAKGVSVCPNCQFNANKVHGQKPTLINNSGDFQHQDHQVEKVDTPHMGGTINPYMMSNIQSQPEFFLRPIARIDEKRVFVDILFQGDEVVLNRDNTEPGNNSITSRRQAVVTNENGHWYIEDCSDMKTTFIQVGRRMEVRPGDTILLGNRQFVFRLETGEDDNING